MTPCCWLPGPPFCAPIAKNKQTSRLHLCELPRREKSLEREVDWWLSSAGENEEWEKLLNGYGVSLWDDENVLELHRGRGDKTL